MKTQSDKKLSPIQDLGSGRWYYHFNEKEKIDETDGRKYYEYDTLVFNKVFTIKELLKRLPKNEHEKAKSVFSKNNKLNKNKIDI